MSKIPAADWAKRIKTGSPRADIENSALIMLACTLVGLLFYVLGFSEANIISIYILGILFISSVTTDQIFCVISSVVGMVLFNCLFAEPRFTLLVFDPQYLLTAVIMLAASLVTSSVTTRFRHQLDTEMTLYKEKERATREAEDERLRANLLRTVSHDLRTPLSGIAGSADILLAKGESISPERRQEMYQSIYDDAAWLSGLVENLLFVTRMENGPVSVHFQPEFLHEIIPEALSHLNKRGKNHIIELNLPEDLLMVRVDAQLIMQVIINITDNAVKYSPAGSLITVTAGIREGAAFVEVADQGEGIGEADKAHVFEMFFTTGTVTPGGHMTSPRGGIGLGLALCQSIVRAHGGEIYVRDNLPQGTIMGFSLQLEGIF